MRVVVLGAGAMGTALALHLQRRGHRVRLWATSRDGPVLDALAAGEPHPGLGVRVPAERVRPGTAEEGFMRKQKVILFESRGLDLALAGADAVLLGLSSEGLGAEWRRLRPRVGRRPVLNIAKGLYRGPRGRVVTFSALAGREETALGGPTIAREVGQGRPSRAVVAGIQGARALWTRALDGPGITITPLEDRVGVEVCGALKNVYAVALGAVEGLRRKRGWETLDNLHAALFTRALGEMAALTRAAGGRSATAYTVAGAGDLEVTARAGRNFGFGVLLGSGHSADGAAGRIGSTVEGARTAILAADMARQRRLDLPLLKGVRDLLRGKKDAEDLLELG